MALWWRLLILAAAAGATAAPGRAALLEFDSQGLAWSVGAVRSATERSAQPGHVVAQPAASSLCRTHCDSIERAWGRLLAAVRAHAENAPQPDWQLAVAQDDGVEASSLPSGRIVLGEAFVRERRLDESQIAFVLAHEIAHVLHQHERQLLTAALALLPRGVTRTVADVYAEMDFNLSLTRSLDVVMNQSEFEADETAIYLAALAGYEPAATLRFLEQDAAAAAGGPRLLATHPDPRVRLERATRCLPLALRLAQRARAAAP